ncbi:hypothetical protein CO115_00835 [Candidatus Falkowbacteria bacterium CG_4_9_14_3_um_filter_36_9]|uniref:Uncharacterized protein n=2 Tax=Candidatus Falkowiibacteriota TaxID=1752728 RepID=A0A1J4T7V9_9BACT|nr:MAG: hypothetical protein AUJ27_03290 [Candidatus Falkowbacteria bacterium CG1_02_37_44]PIV50485.1 MAG: hypothetical protein COS18_04850 [Candidatus Falkowbacteria bacterium CG02_land_8_20_14_3_00_36_14]PIX11117.1 MAG: hypothetical protein COZ73_03540 [Candidatus Falkowbacteria bacterium CG_4_8_14_3_um_filter_36_11]PJA10576.1 MAG: hypothetical protein COX67_04250 [Candidatus Falkowbacteria bacterium CG_4_10_14_0_2_um_filter_36_22]PJB20716.1 MAG: hypothetical protein CO115_00835 [Candidatus F
MNCWEFIKCGREEGGNIVNEFGVCPAYPNGGTKCAEVAGTLCQEKVEGAFTKIKDCRKCLFFKSEYYGGSRGAIIK